MVGYVHIKAELLNVMFVLNHIHMDECGKH